MEVSLWGMTRLFFKFFSSSCQGCLHFTISWGFHSPPHTFFLQVSAKLDHLPKHSTPVSLLRRVPFLIFPLAGLLPVSGPGLCGWGSLWTPSLSLTSGPLPDMSLLGGHRLRHGALRCADMEWAKSWEFFYFWPVPTKPYPLSDHYKKNNRNIILKSCRVEYFPILFLYVIRKLIPHLIIVS